MVNEQPDALRLADDLQSAVQTYPQMSEDEPGSYRRLEDVLMDDAAAELRRLHNQNADYGATIDYLTCENAEQIGEIVALKEQRDELLAALRKLHHGLDECDMVHDDQRSAYANASAIIAKATGETK